MKFKLFDFLIDSVFVLNDEFGLLYANQSACDALGIKMPHLRKKAAISQFIEDDKFTEKLKDRDLVEKWDELTLCLKRKNKNQLFRVLVQKTHNPETNEKCLLVFLNNASLEDRLHRTAIYEKEQKKFALKKLQNYKTGLELFTFTILFAVTGFSFMAIKYAVESFPPFFLNGVRFFVAGLIFLTFLVYKKHIRLSWSDFRSEWSHAFVFRVVGYGGLAYSMVFIPSGLAAVIMGTVPLIIAVIEWFGNRIFLTQKLIIGLALGCLSTLLFVWESLSVVSNMIGLVIISIVALSWSFGAASLGRRRNILSMPYNYLAAGLVLLLFSFAFEDWSSIHLDNISDASIIGFIYLFVFMTLIADPAMTWLMGEVSATKATSFIYVKPIVAVIVGALIANEPFSWVTILGLITMIYGLNLVLTEKQDSLSQNELKDSTSDSQKSEAA